MTAMSNGHDATDAEPAIRAVIVDDEPLARERLRRLLAESGTAVEIVAEAGDGERAVELAAELAPDVMFLDIQMPVLDGFDVVELLPLPRPHIVFVTAFDHHAVRAFEVHALDYLTKPVRLARLKDTLARLSDVWARRAAAAGIGALIDERRAAPAPQPLKRITVHAGRKLRVAGLEEVRWFEACEKTVMAHLIGGSYPVDFTLDALEERLDAGMFIRVHRSYLVNAGQVRELVPWFAGGYVLRLADGAEVPVARRRVRGVRRLLGG